MKSEYVLESTKRFMKRIYLFASVYGLSDHVITANNGDRLVLNCNDRSLGQLQGNISLTWKKDGVTIPNDDPRLKCGREIKGNLLLKEVRQRTLDLTYAMLQQTTSKDLAV